MTSSLRENVQLSSDTLPADATSFLGRQREITEVKRLLSTSRVVTLVGPGGVGKTRLALRVASDARRAFEGNVCLTELANLRDPSLLAYTVANGLGMEEPSAESAIDAIADYLNQRPALLVLDNCEHLVEESAAMVSVLIRACPDLRVLATSRQSLGLLGESTFTVAGFRVPDPERITSAEQLGGYDSIELFAERARLTQPGFTVNADNFAQVARLCHELEGIPLAIELAAAGLRSRSLADIADRLAESYLTLSAGFTAPERQRTLRGMIDWSYDLCSEHEREVWVRTSVFSGSFDLDAVEHITGDDEVLGAVMTLVDKSIFMREEHGDVARYRMLEATREYGAEKLAASGEQWEVRRRHRDWYLRLAAQFNAEWIGPDQAAWVSRLRLEHPNLREALDFCAREPEEALAGLRMIAALHDYWSVRGFHTEARLWLDRLLPQAPEIAPERVTGLRYASWYASLQGDKKAADAAYSEATELAQQLGDSTEAHYLRYMPAAAAALSGDSAAAIGQLTDSLIAAKERGLHRDELFLLLHLGLALGNDEQREEGIAKLQESIERSAAHGEVYWRSWSLAGIGYLEISHDADKAAEELREALRLQHPLRIRHVLTLTMNMLAAATEARGHHNEAATLFGASAALWKLIGGSIDSYGMLARPHYQYLDQARQALGESAFETAFELGSRDVASVVEEYVQDGAPEVDPRDSGQHQPTSLTRREKQIADLVAEGLTNKEIATTLVISRRTVEAHIEHILTKLGVSSRTQVGTWIAENRSA